jgi:hypothetical protein
MAEPPPFDAPNPYTRSPSQLKLDRARPVAERSWSGYLTDDAVPREPGEPAPLQLEDRYRGRAALMNGITISAGSGTVGPRLGGLRTVTQPTLVVIAIATFDSG